MYTRSCNRVLTCVFSSEIETETETQNKKIILLKLIFKKLLHYIVLYILMSNFGQLNSSSLIHLY